MQLKALLDRRDRIKDFLQRHRIGLLTLVFTDLVGSTDLKRVLGDGTAVALMQRHHALLRELLAEFDEAEEIKTAGDSFFLTFTKPSDAVCFALRLQSRLRALAAETGVALKDRVGLHVGEVFIEERGEAAGRKDLFGIQVDTCARVTALGDGDQILLTRFAFDNARQVLLGRPVGELSPISWCRHGMYELQGVEEPIEICEVGEEGRAALKPPADTEKAKRHRDDHLKRAGWRPGAGRIVPHSEWILSEKLGEGGFGEVWQASHRESGELAAFKFSFRDDGPGLLEQAWQTYRSLVASGGAHAGIVEIREAHLGQQPYALRMELAAGRDLAAWCAARGGARQIPPGVRVEIVTQLAEALAHAHSCGVIHKDLKPSNVLVLGEGRTPDDVHIKLTDFGVWPEEQMSLEKSPRTTSLIGSPLYLSPEQARGERKLGPACDIYALGAILYELLTGRPPFVRASFSAVLDAHRYEDPRLPSHEDPDVPDGLQRICLKAMEKRLEDRYASAREMAADLRRFTRGERIVIRPSQYDNFIAGRIHRHVTELAAWRRERLLTDQEFASLAGAYARFDRAGLEAVMETRRLHLWLLLLLLGGWFVLDGCSLWLTVRWPVLSALEKIGIGWFPVVLTNGLWVLFWRKGSYRAAHIMMLLGAVSLPFGIGVFLHAMHWLEVNIGSPHFQFEPIYNAQQLAALLAGIGWTAVLSWRTRTVSISALATVFALLTYGIILDFGDLGVLFDEHLATLALRTLPLALAALTVGAALARKRLRRRQAIPWFGIALVLLILATLTLAWQSPEEWLKDQETGQLLISRQAIPPLQGLLVACCAAIYFPAGVLLRRWFLISARVAYNTLLCLSPLCLLGGVAMMAKDWPASWPTVRLFGEGIPPPDLALGALSVGCVMLAAAVQLRFYAFAGLAFLTLAEWRIGLLYVDSQNAAWAILLLTCGFLLTAGLVLRELRTRRGAAREDMDDVAEHLRTVSRAPRPSGDAEDPLHH